MESTFWLRFCRERPEYEQFLNDDTSKEKVEITLDGAIESFDWCKRLKTFLIGVSGTWTKTFKLQLADRQAEERLFNADGSRSQLYLNSLSSIQERSKNIQVDLNVILSTIKVSYNAIITQELLGPLIKLLKSSFSKDPTTFRSTRVIISRSLASCLNRLIFILSGTAEGVATKVWASIGHHEEFNVMESRQCYFVILSMRVVLYDIVRAMYLLHQLKEFHETSQNNRVDSSVFENLFKEAEKLENRRSLNYIMDRIPLLGLDELKDASIPERDPFRKDIIGRKIALELQQIVDTQGLALFGDVTRRIDPVLNWLTQRITEMITLYKCDDENDADNSSWWLKWSQLNDKKSAAEAGEVDIVLNIDVHEIINENLEPAFQKLAEAVLHPRWKLFLEFKRDVSNQKFHKVPIYVKNANGVEETKAGLHHIIDELFIDDVESIFEFLDRLKVPGSSFTLFGNSAIAHNLVDGPIDTYLPATSRLNSPRQGAEGEALRFSWSCERQYLNNREYLTWDIYWSYLECIKAQTEWNKIMTGLFKAAKVTRIGNDDLSSDEAIRLSNVLIESPTLAIQSVILSRHPNLMLSELPSLHMNALYNLAKEAITRNKLDTADHAKDNYLKIVVLPLIDGMLALSKSLWNNTDHDKNNITTTIGPLTLMWYLKLLANDFDELQRHNLSSVYDNINTTVDKAMCIFSENLVNYIGSGNNYFIKEAMRLEGLYDDANTVSNYDRGILTSSFVSDRLTGYDLLKKLAPRNCDGYGLPKELFEILLKGFVENVIDDFQAQRDNVGRHATGTSGKERLLRFYKHAGITLIKDIGDACGEYGGLATSAAGSQHNARFVAETDNDWAMDKMIQVFGLQNRKYAMYEPSQDVYSDALEVMAADVASSTEVM